MRSYVSSYVSGRVISDDAALDQIGERNVIKALPPGDSAIRRIVG